MPQLSICYNLYDSKVQDIPLLPEAFLVENTNDQLGYIQKQATPEIIDSFNIIYKESPHEQLMDICLQLKPITLEKRFKPPKSRKKVSLEELLSDQKKKAVILGYIYRKLHTFYTLINQHQLLLSKQVTRKDIFSEYLISISQKILEPLLQFVKTAEGITYAFTLQSDSQIFTPKDHTIDILLNEPSWILIDQELYQIRNLNANKLKPFLAKEKIQIPQKHLKTYLDKVIIPIIKNIEVETQGFAIITQDQITGCRLQIIKDFIQNTYIGQLVFEYNTSHFVYNHKKNRTTELRWENDEQITILQTKRNPKNEVTRIQSLTDLGLQLNNNLVLEIPEKKDPFAILDWIITHKKDLQKEGVSIETPIIEGKKTCIEKSSIALTSSQKNDWFDIRGLVIVGDKEVPFTEFLDYIQQGNRFFPINEEEIFIIPIEWMSKYEKLVQFGKIKQNGLQVAKSNYTLLEEVIPAQDIDIIEVPEERYQTSNLLKAQLRPYQLEGVQWLAKHFYNGLGACLADDMGLGKTLQTIAMLVFAKEKVEPYQPKKNAIQFDLFSTPLEVKTYLRTLIVLPSSLVFNWAEEILKFAPHFNIVKYTGPNRKNLLDNLENYDAILTTYTTLSRDIEHLKKVDFTYLVIDESQQIKNKESKIFGAINSINAQHKISLSGTPIENSLSDLWAQMEFINPEMLGSFPFFKEYFKLPIEKHKDQDRIEELRKLIDPFILRRTKEQVAKDLPELSEQILFTEMHTEQEKLYETHKSAARNLLLNIEQEPNNKIRIINTLMKLRQLANHPILLDKNSEDSSGKFEDVTHYLNTLVKSNKKILVFSSFVSHLTIYQQWCTQNKINFVSLTGQTSTKDREQAVTSFQNNENIPLFFISLKAGGTGLNLTKAGYVLLLDPWWNPFIEKQAIARAHRIGQTNNVMVTRFITKNSIEEKILQLQEHKKQLSDDIIATNAIPEYIDLNLEKLL